MVELLAPVGGRRQLEAAINNGADAVYLGGPFFNARIKADNFTIDDLQSTIDFAHERNVKVYITFNTLIKESEISKAFEYACLLYEIGADAVIIQDMGLARLIHLYLPDFSMHLSTQGTIYNTHALDLVKKIGFKRLVLARELSLHEIQSMCVESHNISLEKKLPRLEVEVFVHGALCMCYSGQCQMSRLLGSKSTRSANRGLCAQPCRLPYTDDKGRMGYWLSPKDLCTLQRIPELVEAGVDSFKIEGRLKSAEYVATVTRIYRKYIDLYTKGEFKQWDIDPHDMHEITQIFNRGGFTTGHIDGNPGKEILSGDSPKNQGVYVGEVCGISKEIKGNNQKKSKTLVDVKTGSKSGTRINMGDGVEIRGRIDASRFFSTGNVVTYLRQLGPSTIRIGDFDKSIREGFKVFKVTDKESSSKALSSASKKIPINIIFKARIDEKPTLKIWEDDGDEIDAGDAGYISIMVSCNFISEKAINKPTDSMRIQEQISKLGDTPFIANKVKVDIDEDIVIPVSVINQMRREAVGILIEKKHRRRTLPANVIASNFSANRYICPIGSKALLEANAQLETKTLIPLEEFMKNPQGNLLPYILNISKGKLDEYIEENFDEIISRTKSTGIVVGNLGWIKQFLDSGVKVYGDYGLNAFNSESLKMYEELGVKVINLSHEMAAYNENRFGGKIPLMITEHPLNTEYLIDRKGVKHDVIHVGDKDLIL